ncbi:hypothetical protein L226DRAFT_145648 [Lentinus tigrinus ALCF2SS1-7]|uniref:uncharacterized protein n=1 Tax=Lentinus tigrinus ALCF2SS1-7 TaxID=1328758 RepID=UPI001165DAA4|nr:hypothetical protein L226DRAFT_145648 [Lentinus tigrinus ALCF2SS1-7]
MLLVILTWRSPALRPIVNPLSPHGPRRSLPSILLWNGTLYFIVLTILSILQLSFTLSSILTSGGESFVILFTEPLTTILICRFLLDLHEAGQCELRVDNDDALHFSMDHGNVPSFVRPTASRAGPMVIPTTSLNTDRGPVSDTEGPPEIRQSEEDRRTNSSSTGSKGFSTCREDYGIQVQDVAEESSFRFAFSSRVGEHAV